MVQGSVVGVVGDLFSGVAGVVALCFFSFSIPTSARVNAHHDSSPPPTCRTHPAICGRHQHSGASWRSTGFGSRALEQVRDLTPRLVLPRRGVCVCVCVRARARACVCGVREHMSLCAQQASPKLRDERPQTSNLLTHSNACLTM